MFDIKRRILLMENCEGAFVLRAAPMDDTSSRKYHIPLPLAPIKIHSSVPSIQWGNPHVFALHYGLILLLKRLVNSPQTFALFPFPYFYDVYPSHSSLCLSFPFLFSSLFTRKRLPFPLCTRGRSSFRSTNDERLPCFLQFSYTAVNQFSLPRGCHPSSLPDTVILNVLHE